MKTTALERKVVEGTEFSTSIQGDSIPVENVDEELGLRPCIEKNRHGMCTGRGINA